MILLSYMRLNILFPKKLIVKGVSAYPRKDG